jgi:hypothetical protein
MKTILLALILITTFSCATKLMKNSASFAETSGDVDDKLKGLPPVTAQYEFEGYKVAVKECSFLRTVHLELTPAPTGNFEKSLKKRIEPKTIMGMAPRKLIKQTNPCSRIALYSSMKNIRLQGSKNKFDDKALLAKAILGHTSEGQAYLELTFFEKQKPDQQVRVMYPGYFLTYENVQDMTDDELTEWIVSTLYHVAWK